MKNLTSRLLLILVVFIFPSGVIFSQDMSASADKYSLLTEPFNLRPINMHKGQIQINGGYQFAVRTKSYDNLGSIIDLQTDGSASIQHAYLFDIKYGVLEFLEVGATMNFFKQGVRGKTRNYFSGLDFVVINELTENDGFEDLHLHASLSLPFDLEMFDFSLGGGISIPTANHEPDKPTHTFEYFGFQSYYFNYHYNNNNGTGVMVWDATSSMQLSFSKFTLFATGSYSVPLEEGLSSYWNESFQIDNFIYDRVTYSFLPSETLNIYGSLHYQAIGWLDLSLGVDYTKSSGGWFERFGNKYSNLEKSLSYLEAGMEIQITPNIRLNEIAGFALSGKNMDGPFYFLTSLSFNFIPF